MTFYDDYMRLVDVGRMGFTDFYCRQQGFDWPPPEQINYHGRVYRRSRMSGITDKQRETMTHVCRGAEYHQVLDV